MRTATIVLITIFILYVFVGLYKTFWKSNFVGIIFIITSILNVIIALDRMKIPKDDEDDMYNRM